MVWQDHVPGKIQDLYEIHDYHHAAAILATEFTDEFGEICSALAQFQFALADTQKLGGNESIFPKKFSAILRPLGWEEQSIELKQVVDGREVNKDTHKIDYVKGGVAFDFEWNSKDQTFDRDIFAFRVFYDCSRISIGVLVTRGADLQDWFRTTKETYVNSKGEVSLLRNKFQASSTHMDKLIPRLDAGRNGGCPVLVFGITTRLMS